MNKEKSEVQAETELISNKPIEIIVPPYSIVRIERLSSLFKQATFFVTTLKEAGTGELKLLYTIKLEINAVNFLI